MVDVGESPLAEKECFSILGAFKTYTTSWEGRPRRFPSNMNDE
jgi:hypothetical protein